MNIEFKQLILNNFMSFEDATIDFQNNGYVLVSGINNNPEDIAKSNGSGKSSIWEGIIWCLTGDTMRGTKQVSNKYLDDGALVQLTFKLDQSTYKIIRTKDHKEYGSNLKIFIDGEDRSGKGIRDSEKILAEHLPDLNTDLIGSVIILGQGMPQKFSNNVPSGRKEILEKLSRSDFMIEDIKNKITNRKIKLAEELRNVEDNLLSDSSKKSTLEIQLHKLEDDFSKASTDDLNNVEIELQKDIDFLESKISNDDIILNKVSSDMESTKETYLKLDTTLQTYLMESATKYNSEVEPIIKECYSIEHNIYSLNKDIDNYKNIKDTCPTCGQKIPDVHKVDTSQMESKLQKLKDQVSTKKALIEDIKSKYNAKDTDYRQFIEKDRLLLSDKGKQLKDVYNDLVNQRNQDLQKLSNLRLELQSIKDKKDKLNYYRDTIEDLKTQITQLSETILYNNMKKDNIKSHSDIVNKMSTIATRDFRGFLLSGIINFINNKAKEYALEIFEHNRIDFVLDGNNINIFYCDKQYENLSGGERQKVDLIVQFSIRDMLNQYLNFNSNILVLDEIMDNLDDIGCQRVLNLISNKLNNIENIYIITHRPDLQIPYDKELIITKGIDKISRIL